MEIFINIISHNLTGGIATGLLIGSLLNWYTIRYYNIRIKRANRNAQVALMAEQNEIVMLKKYKADGFDCDYCGRFASNEKVQRNNMHVPCSYKYDEDVTKARKRYGLDS
tara:strand:+ start:309 stop:638 length:330 start_codon:yes stop_codon:yes gene_type:complete